MIYVTPQTPCRYQPGDLIQAEVSYDSTDTYVRGDVVVGEIVEWTNRDPQQLNIGSVLVKTQDDGLRVWVQALRLLTSAEQFHHPAQGVREVTYYCVMCKCGHESVAASPEAATDKHRLHAKKESY